MGVVEQYTSELHQQFGYRATWLPAERLEVGMIGRLNADGSLQPTSSLSSRGIAAQTAPGPGTADYSYTSKTGITISFKTSGQAPAVGSVLGQADAGCTVAFSKDSGIVFAAKSCVITSITDLYQVGQAAIDAYVGGTWQNDEVLVTDVVTAETASILVSQTRGAKIELKASGTIEGAGALSLASVDAGFQAAFDSGLAFTALASPNLTVLYKVAGIRKHLISPPTFQVQSVFPALQQQLSIAAGHDEVDNGPIEGPTFERIP